MKYKPRLSAKHALVILLLFHLGAGSLAAQDRYSGRPRYRPGQSQRFYVWENLEWFQVRVTTARRSSRVFAGVIKAHEGTFRNVQLVAREIGDWLRVSKDGTLLAFRFTNAGFVDGFRFQTDAGAITAFVKISGTRANRKEIYLGRLGLHPLINPFTLVIRGETGDYQIDEGDLDESLATEEVEALIPKAELEEEAK
jgi:hypothetical protein